MQTNNATRYTGKCNTCKVHTSIRATWTTDACGFRTYTTDAGATLRHASYCVSFPTATCRGGCGRYVAVDADGLGFCAPCGRDVERAAP